MFTYLLYALVSFTILLLPLSLDPCPSFSLPLLPLSLPTLPTLPTLYPQGTKSESPRKSMSPFRSTTPKAASPDPFSAGPGETSPKKIPLDLESPKRSSTSTPTMYDIIDV